MGLVQATRGRYEGPQALSVTFYEMRAAASAFELMQRWRPSEGRLASYKGRWFVVIEAKGADLATLSRVAEGLDDALEKAGRGIGDEGSATEFQFPLHPGDRRPEGGEILSHGVKDTSQVDAKVVVYDFVSHPRHLPPRHLRVLLPQRGRNPLRRLSDNLQRPNHGEDCFLAWKVTEIILQRNKLKQRDRAVIELHQDIEVVRFTPLSTHEGAEKAQKSDTVPAS